MDEDSEYRIVSDLGVSMAKLTTRENVVNGCIPFALLYEIMVKRKEIEPLSSLTIELRRKYWNQTTGSKWRRIWEAEALYMFDLLHSDQNVQECDAREAK